MADPLATALRPGPWERAPEVAAALARSLAPPELDVPAPAWLWPAQQVAFRRALAALERYGGALLADPVGTGKTYVALAVAAAVNGRRSTVCLVPAALTGQWQAVAGRLGVPVAAWSHERVSRGSLPPHSGPLVVVDESHRFRNPETRRYAALAPWLVGRRVLLLSATPVVNRLPDLASQLALAVRDDALAPHGVASLAALLGASRGAPELGLVVLASAAPAGARPRGRETVVQLRDTELGASSGLLAGIDRLELSAHAAVAGLVRGVLWRAAASSPAALAASLRRYRRLLLHARDAERSGHPVDRRGLVELTGGLGDQLLLWELLPALDASCDLVTADLAPLEALVAQAAAAAADDDAKLVRLRALLADGRTTLVFAAARETVRWLRERLGPGVAWCTGDRAGIGPMRASRRAVLEWFGPGAEARRADAALARLAPRHLICTDVAAEGLDLQGAERVVHYDLPWTPTRLEQRAGRAVRAGSRHAVIELVRFEPPPGIERRLHQSEALAVKGRLPAHVGLGDAGRALWRWRTDVAAALGNGPARHGVAVTPAAPCGILAGFTLHAWPGPRAPALAAHVLWWDGLEWSEDPELIARRLAAAREAGADEPAPAACTRDPVTAAMRQIGAAVRARVRVLRRSCWDAP
ncbi:MAG TPA: DEAD/DEAH box helicase, partial [Gemmatimonadales bacterium]|nr:DEAD/DEAH box helicase [Gemmatimonadales bacterium]